MATARTADAATVLGGPSCNQSSRPDWCGKILVAGGAGQGEGDPNNVPDPALSSTELYDPKMGTWSSCSAQTASPSCPGPLKTARLSHTATLLADGRVLVAGGRTDHAFGPTVASTELYDPTTGTWSSCSAQTASPSCPGPMTAPHKLHTATRLATGKVLAAGGPDNDNLLPPQTPPEELYDPATGTWRTTGRLTESRWSHTASLLTNGRVLVTAGIGPGPDLTESKLSSELYDPVTELWTSCRVFPLPSCPGALRQDRYAHSATVLADGKVLAAGGVSCCLGGGDLTGSELYEPSTGAWSLTKSLTERRSGHAAALLSNGKVLVAGGAGAVPFGSGERDIAIASAELYDPATAGARWDSAGSMRDARGAAFNYPSSIQAVLISSDPNAFEADSTVCGSNCGRVLVVGGSGDNKAIGAPRLASAELYTPPPTVSGVTPASGPMAGGTTVNIAGLGFTHGTSAVLFGGVPAQSFTVDSYGQITAVSPPQGAGPVEVTVINEGGGSDRRPAAAACPSSPACFTYQPEGPGGGSGGGGPGGSGPGGGGPGATAPTSGAPGLPGAGAGRLEVTGFGMDSRTFAPAGKPTPKVAAARRVRRGSSFRYTLSRSAGVTIAIHRAVAGRQVGRRCRRATSPSRGRRRCVRYVRSGSLVRRDRPAGPNVTPFTGRMGRRALRPGRYRATIVATDPAGERSAPRAVTFKILRASRARKR